MTSTTISQWLSGLYPESKVISVRKLSGGRHVNPRLILLTSPTGAPIKLVLRTWPLTTNETRLAIDHELTLLLQLSNTSIPSPKPLNTFVNGSHHKVPAILTRYLEGATLPAGDLTDGHLRLLATMLYEIHSLRLPLDGRQPYRPYNPNNRGAPPNAGNSKLWLRSQAYLNNTEVPKYQAVLIHRDYHPGNVLWSNGRISGVLDWTAASVGAADLDVAHMRWNLAAVKSVDSADYFRDCYERLSHRTFNPYWDIRCIVDLLSDSSKHLTRRTLPGLECLLDRGLNEALPDNVIRPAAA